MTVYLSDLSQCQPAHLLSREPKPGHWRTLAYETDSVSGTMLVAGPETAAADVVYALDAQGWHEVHFGVFSQYLFPVEFLARLSDDTTFSMVEMAQLPPQQESDGRLTTPAYRTRCIHELFWKTADLTDQDLVLGQRSMRVSDGDGSGAHQSAPTRIAYIKLVPLSQDQMETLKVDRDRRDTKRLFGHNDAHGPHQFCRPMTEEALRRHIECFGDSDFGRLYWEAGGGDELNYFTEIGRMTTRIPFLTWWRTSPTRCTDIRLRAGATSCSSTSTRFASSWIEPMRWASNCTPAIALPAFTTRLPMTTSTAGTRSTQTPPRIAWHRPGGQHGSTHFLRFPRGAAVRGLSAA